MVLPSLTFIVGYSRSIENGAPFSPNNHECERREHYFFVLWEYLSIFRNGIIKSVILELLNLSTKGKAISAWLHGMRGRHLLTWQTCSTPHSSR